MVTGLPRSCDARERLGLGAELIGPAGQQHDREAGYPVGDGPGDLLAAEVGQAHVGQHDVEGSAANACRPAVAVCTTCGRWPSVVSTVSNMRQIGSSSSTTRIRRPAGSGATAAAPAADGRAWSPRSTASPPNPAPRAAVARPRRRQADREHRALAHLGRHRDLAAVLPDDAECHAQTQAVAALPLGGEERLEQPLPDGRLMPTPVSRTDQEDVARLAPGRTVRVPPAAWHRRR